MSLDAHALLEALDASVAVHQRDGTIVYVNRAAERLLERSREQVLGQRIWDLYPDAVAGPFHGAFGRVAASGRAEALEHLDESRQRWLRSEIYSIGELVHVVARDVTAPKQAERRLVALSRAAGSLGRALGTAEVVEEIARSFADLVGDGCLVRVAGAPGRARGAAAYHPDPAALAAYRKLVVDPFAASEAPGDAPTAGEPLYLPVADPVALAAVFRKQVDRDILGRAGVHSLMAMPLGEGARPAGVVILLRDRTPGPYSRDDRSLLVELADCAAASLTRARLYDETDRARRRASVSAAASRALAGAVRHPRGILDVLVRACVGELADGAVATIASAEPGMPGPIAVAHADPLLRGAVETLFGTRLSLFGATPEGVVASGRTVRVAQVDLAALAAAVPAEHRHLVQRLRPRSYLVTPIVGGGRILGTLLACRLGDGEPRPLDDDDQALLEELAARAGLAIENAQALEAERLARQAAERVADHTRRLQVVISQLSHRRAAGQVAETVLREIVAALGGSTAAIWLLEPTGRELRMLASVGYDDPPRFSLLPIDAPTPLGEAVRANRPVYLASVAELRREFPHSIRRLADVTLPAEFATACVPLESHGVVVGGLAFVFAESHDFPPDERTFLEVLAHQCAQSLDRTLLLEQERAATAALTASNRTLNAIIAASRAAILLLDADGTVRLWNPAAERMFGWTAAEAIGRVFPGVDADHEEEFRANLGRIIGGQPVAGLEARRRTRDGGFVDLASWASSIDRPDGTLQCLAVLVDITDRKRADEAIRAADRRKDEFLAVLGHELRNPLAPILTALQLIELKGETAFARERAIIERQTRHLVRLVDDLLDVSRITRGKLELELEPVDLGAVVARAVEMASPLLEQRQHHLSIGASPGPLPLIADEFRLAQVLQNLLTNAAKFTSPGGHIRVASFALADRAVVEVEDDGPGIPPELLPVMFEPFVQGQRVIERSQGGLGVGLALVRSLVALHGGEVSAATNAPAPGSRFTISLPLAPAPAVGVPAPVAVEVPVDDRARRVLVVDDNTDAAEMLALFLRTAGHEVLVAHDGPSAISAAGAFAPEIALLDIGLPVMDGYELARRLVDAQVGPLRLVALTGYGQDHDRQRAVDAGFEAHLVKPVEADRLLEVLGAAGATDGGLGAAGG